MSLPLVGPTRKSVIDAIYALVKDVSPFLSSSRRLRLPSDVPAADRPAICVTSPDEVYGGTSANLSQRTWNYRVFCYFSAAAVDPAATEAGWAPMDIADQIMDALDAAIQQVDGADIPGGLRTLGGLVQWCQISGNVIKVPGDLNGDGLLIVPLQVRVP